MLILLLYICAVNFVVSAPLLVFYLCRAVRMRLAMLCTCIEFLVTSRYVLAGYVRLPCVHARVCTCVRLSMCGRVFELVRNEFFIVRVRVSVSARWRRSAYGPARISARESRGTMQGRA